MKNSHENILIPKTQNQALKTARIKLYPDQNGRYIPVEIIAFETPKFNPEHFEEIFPKKPRKTQAEKNLEKNTFWYRSLLRAKKSCFDYINCNPEKLNTFLTFTVDGSVCDRFDYEAICKKLTVWLQNRVQRNGLCYILVPERHKNGAIHFHGIANAEALKLIDSGHKRQKQTVYNVADMPLGFSTAIIISGEDSTIKVAKYIFKYMTKQAGATIGGRYYLHGGDLKAPEYLYSDLSIEDIKEMGGYEFQPYEGQSCAIWTREL